MKRPCEQQITEPEARPYYPWVDVALRAKDPNAFLMGLGETEFAALLAELRAMGSAPLTFGGLATRRRRSLGRTQSDGVGPAHSEPVE